MSKPTEVRPGEPCPSSSAIPQRVGPSCLDLADADIIVYSSYGSAEDSGQLSVLAGPLWPRLAAVEKGQAFLVEDDVYFTGIGLGAASLIVEDMSDKLAT